MDLQFKQVDEDEGSLPQGKVNRYNRENRKISGCPPDQVDLNFPINHKILSHGSD